MHKHGISHGLAVLITSLISAFFIELLRPHFPKIIEAMDNLSATVTALFRIPLPNRAFSIIILAVILSYFWGAVFKIIHKD